MKVFYDKRFDIASIEFSKKNCIKGVEVLPGVILHIGDKSEVVILEIHDASKHFPVNNLFKVEVDVED